MIERMTEAAPPPLQPLPLVVLGGRDRQGTQLPTEGAGKHPLHGYKGLDLRIGGQPLIAHVIERMRGSGAFDPIFIAGPAERYQEVLPEVPVIDTDSDFGTNLRHALEGVVKQCPGRHVAVVTCDVLPDAEDLERMLDDYRRHSPCDYWFALIRVPPSAAQVAQRLGESQWKPRYRIIPDHETTAIETLPGHLLIIDPPAVRRELVYHALEAAYRTRNRSIHYRRAVIFRSLLGFLLRQDWQHVLHWRRPTYLYTVIVNGLRIAHGLQSGKMTQKQLQTYIHRVYVRYHHRRSADRQSRLALVDALSFAKDIDTEEEAREAQRQLDTSDSMPS